MTKISNYSSDDQLVNLPCRDDFASTLTSDVLFVPTKTELINESGKTTVRHTGVDQHGNKIVLLLSGYEPYITMKADDFAVCNPSMFPAIVSEFKSYTYDEFTENQISFIKIMCGTKSKRANLIELLEGQKIRTYSNETDCSMQYLRESGINSASWNVLHNPNPVSPSGYNARAVYRGNVSDLVAMASDKDIPMILCAYDIETYTDRMGDPNPRAVKSYELFMICCAFYWHHSAEPLYQVCITAADVDDDPDMFREQEDITSEPNKYNRIIHCADLKSVSYAFMQVCKQMQPDFLTGYNSGNFDTPSVIHTMAYHFPSRYIDIVHDCFSSVCKTPWYISNGDKSRYEPNGIPEAAKWALRERTIKLTAENKQIMSVNISVAGITEFDTMVEMLRFSPNMHRVGLNDILSMMGFRKKFDLSYEQMFKIYREKTDPQFTTKMVEVAKYCLIDAKSCQILNHKKGVVLSAALKSNLTGVLLSKSLHNADGGKIRNMILKQCHQMNIQVHIPQIMLHANDEKYDGARVIPPKRGRYDDRPSFGVDYSSLYPSIMRLLNSSGDRIVTSVRARELQAKGYRVMRVSPKSDGDRTFFDKIDIIDGDIDTYYFVGHNNFFDGNQYMRPDRQPLPNECMGAIPSILHELFAQRANVLKPRKLDIEKIIETLGNGLPVPDESYAKLGISRDANLDAEWAMAHYKQAALKTVMNTFYGETGNKISPIYAPAIAPSVTYVGREALRDTEQTIVSKFGANILYGDTDSLYVQCVDTSYNTTAYDILLDQLEKGTDFDVDEYKQYIDSIGEHYDNRSNIDILQYIDIRTAPVRAVRRLLTICRGEYLIRETFKHIPPMLKVLNERQAHMTRTEFLTLAYEEVLYPSYYIKKKSYFGYEHMGHAMLENVRNPKHPKTKQPLEYTRERLLSMPKLFCRGVDGLKPSKNGVEREIAMQVARDILQPGGDAIECAQAAVRAFVNRDLTLDEITIYKRYKPEVAGSPCTVIVNNMIDMAHKHPEKEAQLILQRPAPYSKVPLIYTIVPTIELDGRKRDVKVTDMLVFREWFEYRKLSINKAKYAEVLCGVLASFMNGEPRYWPEGCEIDTDMSNAGQTMWTKKISEKCKKALINIVATKMNLAGAKRMFKNLRQSTPASMMLDYVTLADSYPESALDITIKKLAVQYEPYCVHDKPNGLLLELSIIKQKEMMLELKSFLADHQKDQDDLGNALRQMFKTEVQTDIMPYCESMYEYLGRSVHSLAKISANIRALSKQIAPSQSPRLSSMLITKVTLKDRASVQLM